MMPSGHKAFLVHNPNDVDLLLMHNKTYAAEYVYPISFDYSSPMLAHNFSIRACAPGRGIFTKVLSR